MIIFNVYSVMGDGSKVLLNQFNTLVSAQNSMTDNTLTYSIEEFNPDSNDTTVIL